MYLFYYSLSYEIFGYLYGIEGGAFLYLVAYNPEGQTILVGQIFTDTAYIYGILACKEKRHGILLLCGIVHEYEPVASSKSLSCLFYADGALGFYPDAFGV